MLDVEIIIRYDVITYGLLETEIAKRPSDLFKRVSLTTQVSQNT